MKIGEAWILYEPELSKNSGNYDVWQGEYARIKKNRVWFRIDREKNFEPCFLSVKMK